jgi:hypothetical protein
MFARWSFLLWSAFACLPGSGVCASAEEWKQQSYPDDGFQIEFSGPVTVTETAVSDETRSRIVRATNYSQESGGTTYFVAAMLMRNGVNFDGGSSDSFLASRCETTKKAPVTLVGAEKGVEMQGSNCLGSGSHFEQRFFQRGKWFYQVTAIYAADGDAEAARHFLNSFKLLWQAEISRPMRAASLGR